MTVKTLQIATGGRPLWVLMMLENAIKFIAVYAGGTCARARFVINLKHPASAGSPLGIGQQHAFGQRSEISWQSEAGQPRECKWQSEFGVGSKPAGRRLRHQFRGLCSATLAVSVVGFLRVFIGVAGDERHRDALMGDVNWAVAA